VIAIGQAMFHPTCGPPIPSPADPEKKNGLVAAARSEGRVDAYTASYGRVAPVAIILVAHMEN